LQQDEPCNFSNYSVIYAIVIYIQINHKYLLWQ